MTPEQATATIGEAFVEMGYSPAPTAEKVAELALRLLSELGELEPVDMPRLLASAALVSGAIETVLTCRAKRVVSENQLAEVLW